jgi:DNA polymerase-1
MGDFSFDEQQTGVIFGFLRQIIKFAKLYKTNQLIFCWDSSSSLRKKISPVYKANRTKTDKSDEEKEFDAIAYKQFHIIRDKVLPYIGFKNNFFYEGYEADDIIAEIIMSQVDDKFVIVSADSDLYQLLFDKEVTMYNTKSKKEVTYSDFVEEHSIYPDDWLEVKAIAGCSSDNVIGVHGVGEKTAIKFIKGELSPSLKTYQNIKNSRSIIDKNLELVSLPFPGTPTPVLVKDSLDVINFIEICQRFGFESLINKDSLNVWKTYIFKTETLC